MWETRSVQITVRLPHDIAEQVEGVQRENPEFLSRVVLYGLTRRSIYHQLRERTEEGVNFSMARVLQERLEELYHPLKELFTEEERHEAAELSARAARHPREHEANPPLTNEERKEVLDRAIKATGRDLTPKEVAKLMSDLVPYTRSCF